MALNKQKGQMYPWVTHTWNPIRGNCPHQCSYCYMKIRGDLGPIRLDEHAILDDLGRKWKDANGFWLKEKTIFVGSSTDMWAEAIPTAWIGKVLEVCRKWSGNTYVYQTKNPVRYEDLKSDYPPNFILGTTIESNFWYPQISEAPPPDHRYLVMKDIHTKTFVSIEPIMDFKLQRFVRQLKEIEPLFVSIGADSQGHKLPEPPPDKIKKLIEELQKFTEVKIKPNLKRLLKS